MLKNALTLINPYLTLSLLHNFPHFLRQFLPLLLWKHGDIALAQHPIDDTLFRALNGARKIKRQWQGEGGGVPRCGEYFAPVAGAILRDSWLCGVEVKNSSRLIGDLGKGGQTDLSRALHTSRGVARPSERTSYQ